MSIGAAEVLERVAPASSPAPSPAPAASSGGGGLGLKLLAMVLGFWLVMRSRSKDTTGRTLIDHILNRPKSINSLLDLSSIISAGGTAATGAIGALGGGKAPFPGGWTPGRADQGYDGTFKGSIVAPFSGTITYSSDSFANWGGYLNLKSDHGQIPGLGTDTLYFAEGLHPTVPAGTHVQAGQPIAAASGQGPQAQGRVGLIEWGAAKSGSVGSPSDPLQAGRGAVLTFLSWAEKTLGLPPPNDLSSAGSF